MSALFRPRGQNANVAYRPLSEQSIAILKQIKDITGNNELIFPGDHNPYKPMCENTVNKALRVMGYDTKRISAVTASGQWHAVR